MTPATALRVARNILQAVLEEAPTDRMIALAASIIVRADATPQTDAALAEYGTGRESLVANNVRLEKLALRLERERDEALEALESIRDLQQTPFEFPTDWHEQINACPECQRYKGHPIQQGICDTHRRPLYERDAHDQHEEKAIGYRAMRIASDALSEPVTSEREMSV